MNHPSIAKFAFGALAGALLFSVNGLASAPVGPEHRCLVELRFSPPAEIMFGRQGAFEPIYEILRAYALSPGAGIPDYKIGVSSSKMPLILLMQDCLTARKTMAEIERRYRQSPRSFAVSFTYAAPGPGNLRGVQFYLEKPKFRQRDCIVGIQSLSGLPGSFDGFADFLLLYTSRHIDRFSLLSISSKSNDLFLIEFYSNCDRRLEMTRSLVDAFGRTNGNAASLIVLEKRFEPAPEELELPGDVWLDPVR